TRCQLSSGPRTTPGTVPRASALPVVAATTSLPRRAWKDTPESVSLSKRAFLNAHVATLYSVSSASLSSSIEILLAAVVIANLLRLLYLILGRGLPGHRDPNPPPELVSRRVPGLLLTA